MPRDQDKPVEENKAEEVPVLKAEEPAQPEETIPEEVKQKETVPEEVKQMKPKEADFEVEDEMPEDVDEGTATKVIPPHVTSTLAGQVKRKRTRAERK